ncbi:Smr/MutS family protein [Croceicoccus sp. F390]|uniref:Smr/MutS family protein n=1 Tax=Croceicoccus esteveae TaxID=3075597 RepID=A0ABU2ZGN5_9SPHN|nr:Smr/MutS family protein [Croceicoccus sp. F390]MDT0575754.1 Smr/MutS family protein [Croceicoccus sp. F390]
MPNTGPGARKLSPEEQRSWAQLAATVTPLDGGKRANGAPVNKLSGKDATQSAQLLGPSGGAAPAAARTPTTLHLDIAQAKPKVSPAMPHPMRQAAQIRDGGSLDASWDRKMARASVAPDFTLDLHGHTLDAAYARLNAGLQQAVAQGARLLLIVAGKPRPVHAADRSERRGAIRAKLMDWIAAGPHAGSVAAIRPAHPRHGGQGALYVVLKRRRG